MSSNLRGKSNQGYISPHDHCFRDESPKKRQLKMKCVSCGCWAERGKPCYFCRSKNPAAPPSARAASDSFSRAPCITDPANEHKFRDEQRSKKPQVKMKCTNCGCWATRGGQCYHCGTQTPKYPPSATAAGEAFARTPLCAAAYTSATPVRCGGSGGADKARFSAIPEHRPHSAPSKMKSKLSKDRLAYGYQPRPISPKNRYSSQDATDFDFKAMPSIDPLDLSYYSALFCTDENDVVGARLPAHEHYRP